MRLKRLNKDLKKINTPVKLVKKSKKMLAPEIDH